MVAKRDTSLAVRERAINGNGLRGTTIENATAQATMQPWVAMERYQLSRGSRVSQLNTLDLGCLQIVQEHQHVAIQKLGNVIF
ncbi:hypothetical protein [uncultured Devosia sp.]|uniref:hypothetical protein n=1 Tax=uncultured Devosia sp. TaxID=211434 RepID=UPI0030ED6B11|tara:strand:+ start:1184 stop:1432 length:249 start_codon:yes stop_codon:yes gene_type:complete